jgi:hypothetical protein
VRAASLALFLASLNAHADGPVLVAPKPLATPPPVAPAGTTAVPSFLVDAVVSKTGEVLSASVVLGDAALADDVLSVVRTWRFEPATRDGAPVSAKIHLRVEMVLPPPAAPPATEKATTRVSEAVPAPTLPATPEAPEDVIVRGARPIAPHVQILAAEVREMPGAFGDAFRAIEALPGVTPIISGIPYFVIRGAPPSNTGYFIDDIKVPALFHFGVGQAVIHPALVESVNLYSGAYPASFGRFAGGILEGTTVPPSEKLHGEANVRILDTGALLESPFAGGKGDAIVSGRVGYPGLLLSIFDPSVGLQYYDYQARVSYQLPDGSVLRFFGFGSYDNLETSSGGGPLQPVLSLEFERGALSYTRRVAKTGELRIEAIVGHDRTASGSSPPIILESQTYALRADLTLHPLEGVTLRTGADIDFEPYRFDFTDQNASSASPGDPTGGDFLGAILPTAQNDLNAGAYAEVVAKLSQRVEVAAGGRVDLFTASYPGAQPGVLTTESRQVVTADPRLTARIKVVPRVTLVSAFGMAHQPSNIPFPVPAVSFSQLGRGVQTTYQASEGVETKLPLGFVGSLTLYANEFAGLAQLTNNCLPDAPPSCAATTVFGRSYGVEVLIRRNLTERLTGWVSYTFSRSERDSYDGATNTWGHQASEFDRPHVANVIVAYDLGAHWRAGARFLAYSGSPYATASIDGAPNARTPPFYRLDLRLEKSWYVKWGKISAVAEWLNVFLQKETLGVSCLGASTNSCSPETIGPITIPSLGVEAKF